MAKSYMWLAVVVVLLSLLMSSCVKDPIETGGSSVTADGKVLVSLSVRVPMPDAVQTKATEEEESQISALTIIVLDADNKLSQSAASATFNGTTWKVTLAPNSVPQNIYAIANLSTTQQATLENLAIGTTYEDIRIALSSSDVTAVGVIQPFMMFSHMIQTAITPTMGAKQIELTRAVARIDVKVNGTITLSDFTLESVTLLNAAKKHNPIPITPTDLLTGGDVIKYNEVSAVGNSVASAIYCYENNTTQSNATQLLIKGKYKGAATSGYHKLNIVYKNGGTSYYDIKRNCIYTVNITAVNNNGYNTEAEALSAPPSNGIFTDVVVSDAEAQDILSNGSFYLGFSNSECIIYTSEGHSNELIATFSHNAPSWAGNVTAQVQGADLALNNSSVLPASDGSVKSGSISVDIGNNFSSGSVIVKLGNLEKTIKISRNMEPLAYGGAFNLGNTYVYAKKLDVSAATEWIKLSPNEDASAGDDELDNPEGSIHMQLEINLKLLGGADRTCDLICARSNDEGRVRVKVSQYAFDIFQTDGQVNNTYVGTFHRWNQVGERVISMANPGTDIWAAVVVAGKEFINLEEGGSADPLFGTNNPGNAESYPVTDNKSALIGAAGSPILFKVGMKSPLTSENAQPRYGLILVTHAGGINRIFVRQGEAADYVMRKIDAVIGAPDGASSISRADRPFAVRFSPFNLTDPNGGLGRVDLGNNGGGFVQHPSLGGYHFKANKPYGWYPESGYAAEWDLAGANTEPCPPNYRRPQDGATWNTGFVDGSEMRQSLWYYPQNGSAKSDYYNTIRGCLADGYFDRLSQSVSNVYGTKDYKVIIAGTRIDAAFIGTLIFNPLNNASIFLPASGTRGAYNNGNLVNQGESTYWWSSTPSTSSGVNTWYGAMTFFSGKFTFDNYASATAGGFPIRCVTVDNP